MNGYLFEFKKMIKIKTTVEVIEEYSREDLRKDLQKKSLKEIREFALKYNILRENTIKEIECFDECTVHSDVEVTED